MLISLLVSGRRRTPLFGALRGVILSLIHPDRLARPDLLDEPATSSSTDEPTLRVARVAFATQHRDFQCLRDVHRSPPVVLPTSP